MLVANNFSRKNNNMDNVSYNRDIFLILGLVSPTPVKQTDGLIPLELTNRICHRQWIYRAAGIFLLLAEYYSYA